MRKSLSSLFVASFLALAACGGSSDSKDLNKFIGTWSPASGTFTVTCNGTPQTSQVTDTEIWTAGSTSDLVQTPQGTSCVFHANVGGNTATGVAGQTCLETGPDYYGGTISYNLTFVAYTFVVSTDGMTATENYSGSVVENDSTTGASVTCTFTQTASYTKQ